MHDESLILESVWAMVDRGDINPQIAVYPGFYPYQAALVRILAGPDPRRTILATRIWSLFTMVLALLIPFSILSRLPSGPWPAAAFTTLLALHPEVPLWASRVHPDAALILLNHTALALWALSLERNSRRLLYGAVFVAALSAGTKLVGGFIFAAIVAQQLWSSRRAPLSGVRTAFLLGALFLATFVATTPLLARYPTEIVRGLLIQHDRNVSGGGTLSEWMNILSGPRGIGYAGLVAVVIGVAPALLGKGGPGLRALVGFSLFFGAFVIGSVHLTLPRYLMPAMIPIAFATATSMVNIANARARGAAIAALAALYIVVDLPRMRAEWEIDRGAYAAQMTPDKQTLGDRLARDLPPGARVVSSAYVYVPVTIQWHYVWNLDDWDRPGIPADAVVIDGYLQRMGGQTLTALKRGELGFTQTATIGEFGLFLRHP